MVVGNVACPDPFNLEILLLQGGVDCENLRLVFS